MENGSLINAPAPWSLVGSGYIILMKLSPDFVFEKGFVTGDLKGRYAGGLGTVMFVDYLSSDVGPYKELLFIPGMFSFGRRTFFSITRIFVSTEASVENGRKNWGIPKERADFSVDRYGDNERIHVSREGRQFVELHFRPMHLSMPVTSSLVPQGLRTLAHHYEGRTYLTTPGARGAVSPARLMHARIDGDVFPDFTQGRILGTMSVPRFLMTFPEARVL